MIEYVMENLNTKAFISLLFIIQFLCFSLMLIFSRWAFSRKINHQLEEIRAYLMGLGKEADIIKHLIDNKKGSKAP